MHVRTVIEGAGAGDGTWNWINSIQLDFKLLTQNLTLYDCFILTTWLVPVRHILPKPISQILFLFRGMCFSLICSLTIHTWKRCILIIRAPTPPSLSPQEPPPPPSHPQGSQHVLIISYVLLFLVPPSPVRGACWNASWSCWRGLVEEPTTAARVHRCNAVSCPQGRFHSTAPCHPLSHPFQPSSTQFPYKPNSFTALWEQLRTLSGFLFCFV